MGFIFKLVGYDRKTDRLTEEFEIPAAAFPLAKRTAGIDPESQGPFGDYPLSDEKAVRLAHQIGLTIAPARNEYFLETYRPRRKHA